MQHDVNSHYITIVYDGMCHLCSNSVRWISRHIAADRVTFVSAQSGEGSAALRSSGLDALSPESFLLIKNGVFLQKSNAIVVILDEIGGSWRLLSLLTRLIPTVIADKLYDWIAANRYRWFGRRETCDVFPSLPPET